MAWFSAGELTNPVDATILADTGIIADGNNTHAAVVVTSSVAAAVLMQQRAAGGAAQVQQIIRVPAASTVVIPIGIIAIDPGGRMRVITSGAITGLIQASIVYQ